MSVWVINEGQFVSRAVAQVEMFEILLISMGSSAIRSSIVVSIMIEDLRWECYVITSVLLGLIRVVCEARALRWHCNEWDDANN